MFLLPNVARDGCSLCQFTGRTGLRLFVAARLQRQLQGSQLSVSEFVKELINRRQQAARNLCLLQSCLRDDADLAVSFEVCVQRANIVIIEGDEAVLFPTVLVEVGSW